jgi:chromosome partitioning protein
MITKVISFATQKGGSGKTTLLMLTAAAIHNRTDLKVLVVDADPQRSVKSIFIQDSDEKSYDVYAFNWKQANPEINFEKSLILAKSKYNIVLIDVPGRMEGAESYYSLLYSDIVVVPVVASQLDLLATKKFLEKAIPVIQENKSIEKKDPLRVYGVINKKDQSIEYQKLKELQGLGGLEFFYSPISNLVRYKRAISTVKDITDPNDEKDEFNMYFDEFMSKCYYDMH